MEAPDPLDPAMNRIFELDEVRGPFHFPGSSAEEQWGEVERNALFQRMQQSRRQYALCEGVLDGTERYRPRYHYVNPEGPLNDPNGLCFWQGRWHLFYQAYPPRPGGRNRHPQHWGHCVSDDLIHWRDLPLALFPGPEGCCFSGSCFVEEHRVIAMYHGTRVGNMVATSSDPLLLNWKKLRPTVPPTRTRSNGAVIPFPGFGDAYESSQIFDPCIWKDGDTYYSLSAGSAHPVSGAPVGCGEGVPAEWLFSSKDLAHWTYMHNFLEDRRGRTGDDGACPYFWPIGPAGPDQKHLLCHFSHARGGKYILGDYDRTRQKLVVTDGGNFNFGAAHPSGVHAPTVCPLPDDPSRLVCIFNMNAGIPGKFEPLFWTQASEH